MWGSWGTGMVVLSCSGKIRHNPYLPIDAKILLCGNCLTLQDNQPRTTKVAGIQCVILMSLNLHVEGKHEFRSYLQTWK